MTTPHDHELGVRLFRTMTLIRAFEARASKLMLANELPGFVHVSIGQEAVAAGVCDALRSSDQVSTTHRGHGHCLAKGGDPARMMAELFGRENGYGLGRSGSMHIADPSVGILGANAIVGGGIPMAVGAALAASMAGNGDVAVAFFGEGAVAQGVFHESLNLAALWRLPVIFVCENNQYAEMTPMSVHLSSQRVADHAQPYGIPSSVADGNDVWAVHAAAQQAIERARAGQGPTLLEFLTYRWSGHFEGDPGRYRADDEVRAWKDKDPIERARQHLLSLEVADETLDAAETTAAEQVDHAVDEARAAALAPAERLVDHLYADAAHG